MHYIGVDIAKYKHVLAAIGDRGERVIENYVFTNTTEGFTEMLKKLSECDIAHEDSKICIESTGHYGKSLCAHLEAHGFEVNEVNPILTHNWRKAMSVRKVKNDAVDALALAQWLLAGNPISLKSSSEKTEDIKVLARSRTFHSRIIGDSKRKVIALLDQVFPEYARFFTDAFGKTSLAVLRRWQSPEEIAHARIDILTRCLSKASRNKFGRDKAISLKALAKNSFGTGQATEASTFQMRQLIAQIDFTQKQMEEIDGELKRLLDKAKTPITTIPGIGVVAGATILGEIGDIENFDHPSKLVAFAGYDPSVFESGEFTGTKCHISKRGSSQLRWMLWIAADRARLHDPVLKEYYLKKRSEGKCHKVAVCALIRKMCNIIFAVLRDDKPYTVPQR